MKDISSLEKLKLKKDKLFDLGFKKVKDKYIYSKEIIDNQFVLKIEIADENIIYSSVIEKAFDEEFIQYNIVNATGNYVNKMKQEYENVIQNVIDNCCEKNVFKNEYTNLIISYIKNKYNDELEYLWDKFPEYAAIRNKVNNKWYGVLMVLDVNKLNKDMNGKVEVINLRMDSNDIELKVDNNVFFKGYHMNKRNWITLKLDGSININDIYDMIDKSYEISLKK